MGPDDIALRAQAARLNPARPQDVVPWLLSHVSGGLSVPDRLARLMRLVAQRGFELLHDQTLAHVELAGVLAQRLGLPHAVKVAVHYEWQRWDGKGVGYEARGNDIPIVGRILHLAQTMDAMYTFAGPEAAVSTARQRSGTDFDPGLVHVFLEMAESHELWQFLARDSVQEPVLSMRSEIADDGVTEDRIDIVCEALGDLTDIISRFTFQHSQQVAEAAAGIGRCMGLTPSEVTALGRYGLVHDLGNVTVPSPMVEKEAKGEKLTVQEQEQLRLHPYHTERILSRTSALRDAGIVAGLHHERIDGLGYPKQVKGSHIPLAARALALAEAYVTARARRDAHSDPENTVDELRPLVGTHFDPDCYEALVASLGGTAATPARRRRARRWSGELSEREAEVLRSAARGLKNREIASSLGISEKTVERHFENIFNKLGVASRTSAILLAVQSGVVPLGETI